MRRVKRVLVSADFLVAILTEGNEQRFVAFDGTGIPVGASLLEVKASGMVIELLVESDEFPEVGDGVGWFGVPRVAVKLRGM